MSHIIFRLLGTRSHIFGPIFTFISMINCVCSRCRFLWYTVFVRGVENWELGLKVKLFLFVGEFVQELSWSPLFLIIQNLTTFYRFLKKLPKLITFLNLKIFFCHCIYNGVKNSETRVREGGQYDVIKYADSSFILYGTSSRSCLEKPAIEEN